MAVFGCLIARAFSIIVLTFILNIKRVPSDRIGWKSQIVLWNAGLRGAVAYALVVSNMMPIVDKRDLMITTVHAVVLFTIVFHGTLTAPILWLTGLYGDSASNHKYSTIQNSRKKLHSFWSRIDKTYIIPFISYPRENKSENKYMNIVDESHVDESGVDESHVDESNINDLNILSMDNSDNSLIDSLEDENKVEMIIKKTI